jgi:hypothetical protein
MAKTSKTKGFEHLGDPEPYLVREARPIRRRGELKVR